MRAFPASPTTTLDLPRAVAILALLAAGSASATPLTSNGTQPPLTYPLLDSSTCAACHQGYDVSNDLEPWDTWAGSMMAQAARDPLFWAALDVANNDVPDIGEWCLRCHVPTGWLAGRSEMPGGSTDGCGLVGRIDELDEDFDGLTCHLCHRMTVNSSPPMGQDSLYVENGQFWLDDTDCGGLGEPCRHGPYDYVSPDPDPPHAWAYSPYLKSSEMCGNCHNVTSPVHNLLVGGVDTGVPFPIERTYREWLLSDYGDSLSVDFATCQSCHMPDATADPAYACNFLATNRTSDLPKHQFAGGNAWIPDVLRQEYPLLGLDAELIATRDWALDMLQNYSATVAVTLADSVFEGALLPIGVRVTNLTGHKLPTGYPEGRRMWLNVQVRDGDSALIWESGAYADSTGVLTVDAQAKVYETKQGIWNLNATSECDCEDGGGDDIFHFVLNDCVKLDNRIPPQGFTGMNDPETRPVGYTYPETAPSSGVLVHWDDTNYLVPVPIGVVSPLTVSATLRYQTASKEYVDFLLSESDTHGFPDDCIPRLAGPPNQTRAEILHDMWTTYGRSPPVDMATDGGSVVVFTDATGVADGPAAARLQLAQNAPNPVRSLASGTRIAYRLPVDIDVRLEILDIRGRHVRGLIDRFEPAGPHSVFWDGRDDGGRAVASGVYLYRLQVGDRVLSRRMIVVR